MFRNRGGRGCRPDSRPEKIKNLNFKMLKYLNFFVKFELLPASDLKVIVRF